MSAVLAISGLTLKEIFRKKDFYAALIILTAVLFYASQLDFYNTGNIVRYLMELGLMLIFLFSVILTTALAARQYPGEVQNRTAYVLLAKPISRFQFILGKFLGALFAGWASFTLFYALFLAVIQAKSGEGFSWVLAAQAYGLFLLCLMTVAAMACTFSYFLTVSANVTLTLSLYLLINTYGAGLKASGGKLFWLSRWMAAFLYYAMPHFEFFDLRQRFVHGWQPLSTGLVFFLALYALAYAAIFLLVSVLLLRKRAI